MVTKLTNFLPALVRCMLFVGFCVLSSCVSQPSNTNSTTGEALPSPAASASPTPSNSNVQQTAQVTLPVLDALLQDESFVSQLKSKLQLNDDQITRLKEIAAAEITRLRNSNAEDLGGDAADARTRATQQIVSIMGESKANELNAFAYEFWAKGGETGEGTAGKEAAVSMPAQPNAVPTDTRIVVNIPAFRMDLFRDGSLVKTYKIGIGYPEFPLPQGMRKAQTIIFNPTWTPPDSPWVSTMKAVTPGETVEAGSKLNPLGPVKIPIGMPSLIHGGKSPAKLGQFASHGCVGLTSAQVTDFARLLAQASGTEISDKIMESYLQDRTHTRVVKLGKTVPVELRYETIVVEDGKLHIFKDVYDQGTNTEENLRSVLAANGANIEDLTAEERAQVLSALNTMSAHPGKVAQPSPTVAINDNRTQEKNATKKRSTESTPKSPKNQKEIILEIASLRGKGYPAPVKLDTGTGKPATAVARR